jgi:hypothetical protein
LEQNKSYIEDPEGNSEKIGKIHKESLIDQIEQEVEILGNLELKILDLPNGTSHPILE